MKTETIVARGCFGLILCIGEGGEADVANENNLMPIEEVNARLTPEERVEKARKAGLASAEARKKKKTMRETAKMLMEMEVSENNKENLRKMGFKEEDQTYQTAVVARLVQKAVVEADTSAIRLIGELTGDITKGGFAPAEEDDIVEMHYPSIVIPDNGRDRRTANELAPQAGPQTMFMASMADIVVYGGAAGGGKTFALLLEGLRHKDVKGFGAVIFRHNYNQITAEGGLWDASQKLYGQVPDAHARKSPKLHWRFDGGAKLNFAHIEREEDLQSWQGTEICYIGFDELTHFSRHQFLYMLSRNRSTCGVRPYVRATCNPDADSWVADLISWWIDQDTGYPIPERSGQIRWLIVISDVIHFFDTKKEAIRFAIDSGIAEDEAAVMPKSFTFIASSIEDNKKLLEADPGYMANLRALTEVDMERLLKGNWKIKAAAGKFFKRTQVELITEIPNDIVMWCRAWDLAATDEDEDGDPDYTAGVLMGRRKSGTIVILDVINQRIKAGDVEKLLYVTSVIDRKKYGYQYMVRIPQDPGASGKIVAANYVKMLAGFNVKAVPVSGSKELRATPLAAQWQNGNIQVLVADWNDMYLSQMESFPESKHDDMTDASSDSFSELTSNDFDIDNLL